jgi:riboflavin synthase
MFTGIVTDKGKVISINKRGDSIVFQIQPSQKNYLYGIGKGFSISVNGACMTIVKTNGRIFEITTIRESLSKTNLGDLKIGNFINLEKPMNINATLDGHIVQGHVDSTGKVVKINRLKDSWEYFISFPGKFFDNIIYVGSISINGVSLTIADIVKETKREVIVKVAIIPHTYNVTNFKEMKVNDRVNIEFDMLGKYVKRILKKN